MKYKTERQSLKFSHGLCYKLRESIGKTVGPQPIPQRHRLRPLDANRGQAIFSADAGGAKVFAGRAEKKASPRFACGPREVVPLRRKNLHCDWHNFWDYGNGEVGNQGVHQMDVAAWAIEANSEDVCNAVRLGLARSSSGLTSRSIIAQANGLGRRSKKRSSAESAE